MTSPHSNASSADSSLGSSSSAEPAARGGGGIMQQIEREIDERAGHRLPIERQMALVEVKAARADNEHGGIGPSA